eukprot:831127-Pleurochrysis_carterae.AAC.2
MLEVRTTVCLTGSRRDCLVASRRMIIRGKRPETNCPLQDQTQLSLPAMRSVLPFALMASAQILDKYAASA